MPNTCFVKQETDDFYLAPRQLAGPKQCLSYIAHRPPFSAMYSATWKILGHSDHITGNILLCGSLKIYWVGRKIRFHHPEYVHSCGLVFSSNEDEGPVRVGVTTDASNTIEISSEATETAKTSDLPFSIPAATYVVGSGIPAPRSDNSRYGSIETLVSVLETPRTVISSSQLDVPKSYKKKAEFIVGAIVVGAVCIGAIVLVILIIVRKRKDRILRINQARMSQRQLNGQSVMDGGSDLPEVVTSPDRGEQVQIHELHSSTIRSELP